jgi:membrane-associated protease RseP (regulator of RpoE activity)
MKYSASLQSATLLASLALATPSPAQDAPTPAPEAAPVPAPAPTPEVAPAPAANPAAKPFLGLGVSSVPDFLGKHLGLPVNSGVMIRSLAEDGPAAKAGFTVDDVITKVDGKAIATHRELVDCFQAKKPGEEIAIDFIHEGKPGNRTVKLGERADEQAAVQPAGEGPKIEVQEGQLNLPQGFGALGNLPPELEKQMREAMGNALKIQGNQMRIQIVPGGNGGVQIIPGAFGNNMPKNGMKFDMASSINMMDDEGAVELKTADGGSEVRVTDKAGKEVWSGPWDTEQDKASAPPKIRERIERLNIQQPPQAELQQDMEQAEEAPADEANDAPKEKAPDQP